MAYLAGRYDLNLISRYISDIFTLVIFNHDIYILYYAMKITFGDQRTRRTCVSRALVHNIYNIVPNIY